MEEQAARVRESETELEGLTVARRDIELPVVKEGSIEREGLKVCERDERGLLEEVLEALGEGGVDAEGRGETEYEKNGVEVIVPYREGTVGQMLGLAMHEALMLELLSSVALTV